MHGRIRWLAEETKKETKYPNKTTSKCLDVAEKNAKKKKPYTNKQMI